MITTTHTATVHVAHRQAELRAQGRSARIARDARAARRQPVAAPAVAGSAWSLPILARRLGLGARRPALV